MNRTSQAVCPKHRPENCNSKRVMKLPFSNQTDEGLDSKAGADIFILKEDGIAAIRPSSSPFYNGSPPTRPMNPLIHDVRFVNYGTQLTISASTSSSGAREGQKTQAPITRVEGFDCPKFSSVWPKNSTTN